MNFTKSYLKQPNQLDICPWAWPYEDTQNSKCQPVPNKMIRAITKHYKVERTEEWMQEQRKNFHEIIIQQRQRFKCRRTRMNASKTEARPNYCMQKVSVINLIDHQAASKPTSNSDSIDLIKRRPKPFGKRTQQTEQSRSLMNSTSVANNIGSFKQKPTVKTFYRTKSLMSKGEGKSLEVKSKVHQESMRQLPVNARPESKSVSPSKTVVQIKMVRHQPQQLIKKLDKVRSQLMRKSLDLRQPNPMYERILEGI